MGERILDLDTWDRSDQFHFFRTFDRPHFSVTARLDVTGLITRAKPAGVSAYHACLFAIGAGIHGVDALRTRFAGDTVTQFDAINLSMTVPAANGTFNYAYLPWTEDFETFDRDASAELKRAAASADLSPNDHRLDMAYLSCLPWLNFTSMTNAISGPDDCIPRITWGKFSETANGFDMAMALELHHAVADGEHAGAYFTAVQAALDQF